MAANSNREQIIEANKTIVEGVSAVKTVKRTLLEYSDLQEFALTQLPVAAVVGRMPVPVEKHTMRTGDVDQIKSKLNVDIFVYIQANDNADVEISSLMDDLWAALYADQSRSGLVISTEVKVEENPEYWAPFAAFKITVEHYYVHSTGGI
jgi:hypothetical protein